MSFTFVQCLFCKNSFVFRADFFCNNVTKYTDYRPNDYCFDVIHHALKIQRKTVVQTKLNQHVIIVFLLYLFAAHAGIEKDTTD